MTTVILLLLLAVIVIGIAAPAFRRRRPRRKRGREAEQMPPRIPALNPTDRDSVEEIWRSTWSWFRDDPKAAVGIIDRLASEILKDAGYDLSGPEAPPDAGTVLSDYHAAHEIAAKFVRGEASENDLNEAMLYYTAVFEALLHPGPAAASGRRAA